MKKGKTRLDTPPIVKTCHNCQRGFTSKFEHKRHLQLANCQPKGSAHA